MEKANMKTSKAVSIGSVLLFLGVFLPASPSMAALVYTSTKVPCTIVGTSRNDILTGTSKNDVICGLGGNDTVNGGAGNDTIDGGDGNDVIDGGVGNDTMSGGVGTDTIEGGDGNDKLNGNDGNDKLIGEDGTDTISGGNGNDSLKGNDGDDTISGGNGNDSMSGGAGSDEESGGEGKDSLNGGAGDDSLTGGAGPDTLNGDAGLNNCTVDDSDTLQIINGSKTCDVGGPTVSEVSYDKTSMNTSTSSRSIVLTFVATDDLAGIGDWGCWAGAAKVDDELLQVSTSGVETEILENGNFGWPLKVRYTMTFEFPIYSAQGDWTIGGFDCRDAVNNQGRYFSGSDNWTYRSNDKVVQPPIQVPVTLIRQTGAGDEELPELVSLTTTSTTFNTSGGSRQITYNARITDDFGINLSGQMTGAFRGGGEKGYVLGDFTYVSGTQRDSTWTATVTYPRYWPSGITKFYMMGVRDLSGKEARYGGGWIAIPERNTAPVTQTGIGDTEGPVITRITNVNTLNGIPIDTRTAAASVTLEFVVHDDLSGALWYRDNAQLTFVARTGGTSVYVCLDLWNCRGSFQIISQSEDHKDTVVRTTFVLPRLAPTGLWDLQCNLLADAIGNQLRTCPSFTFRNG